MNKFRIIAGKVLANEEPVVKQITDGLSISRLPFYRVRERIPGEGALSQAGIPDIGGWIPRKVWTIQQVTENDIERIAVAIPFYIEVKRMGAHKKRPAQIEFIERAKHDGCLAFFAQGWDDCVREFRSFGIELPN